MQTYCWKRSRSSKKARRSSVSRDRETQAQESLKKICNLGENRLPDTAVAEQRGPQEKTITKEKRPRRQQSLRRERQRRQHPQKKKEILCWQLLKLQASILQIIIKKKNKTKQNKPRSPTLLGGCKNGSAVCTRIACFWGNSLLHQG